MTNTKKILQMVPYWYVLHTTLYCLIIYFRLHGIHATSLCMLLNASMVYFNPLYSCTLLPHLDLLSPDTYEKKVLATLKIITYGNYKIDKLI